VVVVAVVVVVNRGAMAVSVRMDSAARSWQLRSGNCDLVRQDGERQAVAEETTYRAAGHSFRFDREITQET
jgi:hypothetical protein